MEYWFGPQPFLATISFILSVRRMEQLGFHWTDFHEVSYSKIFRKSVAKIRVSLKSDKNKCTLREDQYIFIISCSFILRMRNASDTSCRENQNTHFVSSNFFFENRTIYEKMWKNIVDRGRPHVTIWRMRIACWIPKATNTHRLYNTHCFATATMVARTRHNVTSHVHCLSCLIGRPAVWLSFSLKCLWKT
jgi:hypothetical protein